MYRLFAALPVDNAVTAALRPLQSGLPGASWRPLQNFHITLRFFGDVGTDLARDLDDQLAEITAPQMPLYVEGVGSFGRREPHAVWAGVRETDELRALSGMCERAARRIGLQPDKRPFRPHITLAYLHGALKSDVDNWRAAHAAFHGGEMWADQFHLYSSHMGRGPSRYVAEADYPLGR